MDEVDNPNVAGVVLMWASQTTGKTETINNIVGQKIDIDPCPMLALQPTLEMGETWSKDRLSPMLRDTPRLRGKVKSPRARDSGNTILHKRFPGGHLTICGANSAASLASRPIRFVLFDEVDRYPLSTGTEGDPISLAEKRTESFPDAVWIKTSTPTVEGLSRIAKEFELSDKRYWFVPCPCCEKEQTLKWERVRWEGEQTEDAWYECEHCNAHWTDEQRITAVKSGKWVATAPFKGIRGYHINGIYCLFRAKRGFKNRLHQMVEAFRKAKNGGLETLQVWVNTFSAEVWSQDYEAVDTDPLLKRREEYPFAVPAGVILLTAGIDVQMDRIEVEVVGWGVGEESWSIEYKILPGNVAEGKVWEELDAYLASTWKNAAGAEFGIKCAAIDSGNGNHTKYVYDFCRTRAGRRIFAIKGRSGPGVPLISPPKPNKKYRIIHYIVGVDTAKGINLGRLKIEQPGAGYMHFPKRATHEKEFFRQLTAEVPEFRVHHGHHIRIWNKKYTRNEVLDCRNYAMGALAILQPNWSVLTKKLERKAKDYILRKDEPAQPEPEKPAPPPAAKPEPAARSFVQKNFRRRGGFVNSWKSY